jgi:hypothetical protein
MPLHLPLSAGDSFLPRGPPADLLTKWDPRSKPPLSPQPNVLPRTPRPTPPATNTAHHSLGPPGLIGALLSQDPF